MNLDKYLFRQNIKKKVNFALIDNEIKQCYQILEEEHTILNGKAQAEIANFWRCSLRKVAVKIKLLYHSGTLEMVINSGNAQS